MKQILNINLGGYPITIDTDAYEHLSKYLDAIEQHFRESDAAEEILSDIETRMAELFKENIHPRTIVTMPDVKSAVDIMGTPEMFGAEAIDDEPVSSGQKKQKKAASGFKPGKRLFRDPDDKLLGGVSSGLAAYLGISDPIWIRILFVVLTLAGFASIPIYMILWIVMPVAKTSADRLAMRGEPINVESIASSVAEELENFSEKINDQFGNKKKSGGRSKVKNTRWIAALGGIFSTVIIGISQAARPILKLLGGLLILVLVVSWISLVVSAIVGLTKAAFFLPSNTFAFSMGLGGLFLLVGAPIMGLILSILRVFFKRNHHVRWRWSLVGLWILGLFSFSFGAAKISNSYQAKSTYKQVVPIVAPQDKPLQVRYKKVFVANNDARSLLLQNDHIQFDVVSIRLNIQPAQDGRYRLVQVQKARGLDGEDATKGAKTFEYQPSFAGNTLLIPSDYFIPKGERFRVQKVELTLYVPVGEKLILDKKLRRLDLNLSRASGDYDDLLGEEVVMTDGGLKPTSTSFSEGSPVSSPTQVLSLDGFAKINAEGPMALNIQQGEAFRVKVRGAKEGDPINLKVVDGELMVDLAKNIGKEVEVFITMPRLERLAAKNTQEIHVSDIKGGQMEVILDGDMLAKMTVEVDKLSANLNGQSHLDLTGKAESLEAMVADNAAIDGKDFNAAMVAADLHNAATVDVILDGKMKHFGE